MRDPFAKARQQAANRSEARAVSPAAQGASPAPSAPGVGQTASAKAPADFKSLKKKFGLGSLKLDSDPIVARTQLLQHLAQKLGPDFMSQPGVHQLVQSFDAHSAGSKQVQTAQAQSDRIGDLLG